MSRLAKLAGVTLLGVAVAGAMVFAEHPETENKKRSRGEGGHVARMKAMDKNGDGKICFAEFKAGHMKHLEAMFKKRDKNGDGFLSKEDHMKGDKDKSKEKKGKKDKCACPEKETPALEE